MPKFQIEGAGSGKIANVSDNNELITRPFNYSEPEFQNMNVDDTAFNFFDPEAGKQFIITTVVLDADRNVGQDGASVVIYEASADNSTVVDKTLFQFDIPKNGNRTMTNQLSKVNEGKFVNGKTNDNNVLGTIAGYYIESEN